MVWILNGTWILHKKVQFSCHIWSSENRTKNLNTGQDDTLILTFKLSIIFMFLITTDIWTKFRDHLKWSSEYRTIWIPDSKCPIFRWIQISGIRYSDGFCFPLYFSIFIIAMHVIMNFKTKLQKSLTLKLKWVFKEFSQSW